MKEFERQVRVAFDKSKYGLSVSLSSNENHLTDDVEIVNLSRNGMFLKTKTKIEKGSIIDFSLSEENKDKNLKGKGQVLWQRDDEKSPYLPKGIGIEIFDFDQPLQKKWNHIIEQHLTDLQVIDLLSSDMIKIQSMTPISKCFDIIAGTCQDVIVIVDRNNRYRGVVSLGDMISILKEKVNLNIPIDSLITKDSVFLTTASKTEDAIRVLTRYDYNHLPVIENGKVVGVISTKSLLSVWNEMTLLRSQRLRENFVRAMNVIVHDLATPISAIKTSNSLITTGVMNPEEFHESGMAKMVDDNCEIMLSLIEELLTVSKDECYEAKINVENMDLVSLSKDVFLSLKSHADVKKIDAKFIAADTSINILADPGRVRQILNNLLSNAIKYSGANESVELRVLKKGNFAVLEIEDTGQGIDQKELPQIFDEFCRISTKTTNGEPKVGLGMSITKKLVEAHKGTIDVKSVKGEGTRFSVQLPMADIS